MPTSPPLLPPPAPPGPADHFTAFVAALSDPGHERVARAVAGESPSRLRGRILLERAAHLALTTDRPLHDIAVECGFPSYEVFARAFRRELGALPAAWRAEPTSYVIDSPTEVHFHPPAGLRLPARHRTDGVDLVVAMVEQHVGLVGELLDRARDVPDEDLDEPSTGEVVGEVGSAGSLRSALAHLVWQVEACAVVLADDGDADRDPRDVALARGASVATLRERLDRVGADLARAVERLAATGRLDEALVEAFAPRPRTTSHADLVVHLITLSVPHRRLAASRLQAAGVADPDRDAGPHWLATGPREAISR
ncbi:helix-turn-helix domain-containing protein [Nocardioides renjunii]|uniref:helix-turn-helix domain-containing protein n=1 Tax=Nocardioides renjunii TaxID=3095075 RepID=UPI002AFE98EE|nr:helix-turn-helix domain-containing protein [Nocardioides sp. S-34]WQQ21524.1 helix-turn-helix domain-containing protein [Nocardioides sp. S-34]